MDESERVELEADVEKIKHTLESDKSPWQYDYDFDSDDDSEDDEETLYIDLDQQGSATVSLASASARSAGGRTTPSVQSIDSRPTTESQSVTTEQDEDADIFREVGVVLDTMDSTSSLPASLESCLIVNRAYQEIITEHISRIELALAENRESQRKLEDEAKESSRQAMTKKRFQHSYTAPYFKGSHGSTPQPNEDVLLKQRTREPNLDTRPASKWNNRQKRLLIEAVKEDSLHKLLQPLLSRRELEEEKLLNAAENSEEWHAIQDRISALDEDIDMQKRVSDDQLLRDVDVERVDWLKISNLSFGGNRSWQSCRRAWMHYVDPKLNTKDFSPEEEASLRQLVNETKAHNWVYIAQQLGTGRTAFQCLQHYQQNMNDELLQRPWTKEEDEKLLRVVEKCQQYHFNWHRVSLYMEGRNSTQCYKRFTKIDPTRSSGHWTREEDTQLMTAVKLFGTRHWAKVQELVPGRTREQCRERYMNCLDPAISGQPWTYEQDRELLRGVEKYGRGQWVKIVKEFLPGRTDNQVLQRYRRLEDWKRKSEWFNSQPEKVQRMLQGNCLPDGKREEARLRNWDQYRELYNVVPCDYEKQQRDVEAGLKEVPRPPFLLGLANKRCARIWERRLRLQRLVEEHVERERDRFDLIDDGTTAGMYSLREAIKNLSSQVLSRHQEQLAARVISTEKPSAVSVGDMLAISRGNTDVLNKPKAVRGPRLKKKPPRKMRRSKLHAVFKVDSELRQVIRTRMRSRAMKRGRPRRFFWDIVVDQGLDPEAVNILKATALNLYFKSLGADPGKLLASARQCFPDLAAKFQGQSQTSDTLAPEAAAEEKDDEAQSEAGEDGAPLRRSRRPRKPNTKDRMLGMAAQRREPEPSLPVDHELQKKKQDYELLEWMCSLLEIPPEYPPPEQVSANVEIGSSGEPTPGPSASDGEAVRDEGRPTGMQQVHATILQALKESITKQQASEESSNTPSTSCGLESVPSTGTSVVVNSEKSTEVHGGESAESGRNVSVEVGKEGSTGVESVAGQEPPDITLADGVGGTVQGSLQVTSSVDGSEHQRSTEERSSHVTTSLHNVGDQTTVQQGSSQVLSSGDGSTLAGSGRTSVTGDASVPMDISAGRDDSDANATAEPSEKDVNAAAETSVKDVNATAETSEKDASAVAETSEKNMSAGATLHGSLILECSQGSQGPERETCVMDNGESSYSISLGPQKFRVFPKDSETAPTFYGTTVPDRPTHVTVDYISKDNNRRKFPNLPPTRTSMQSFKLLLLKRLELVRHAGQYYNHAYYTAKKDAQLKRLRDAGEQVQALNRGSMDFNRLMNRVTRLAHSAGAGKPKRKKKCNDKLWEDPKCTSLQIMNQVRQSKEYKTLLSRFESVFFWPAFLSAVYPPFDRKQFSEKADGGETSKPSEEEQGLPETTFESQRRRMPLLKSKRFYKFSNKPKEVKKAAVQKQRERRILQQVKKLLADEDDPNPQVSLHFDSDDEEGSTKGTSNNPAAATVHNGTASSSEPQPSTSAEGGSAEVAVKVKRKYKPKPKNAPPSRKSSRNVQRVRYSDKRQRGARRGPSGPRRRELEDLPRLPHKSKHTRDRIINAMVTMKAEKEGHYILGREMGDGYVSDEMEEGEEMMLKTEAEWVQELPEDQKDSVLQLEMGMKPDSPAHDMMDF